MSTRRVFIPVIMIILSYEWVVSGLNKVLSSRFITGLHEHLSGSVSTSYPFYAQLIRVVVLPHSMMWAVIVECGELCVGLSFLILAIYMLIGRWGRRVSFVGVLTGFLAAFMSINFFLYQGGSYAFNLLDPFNEGISIDLIMALIQVTIAVRFCKAMTSSKTHRAEV